MKPKETFFDNSINDGRHVFVFGSNTDGFHGAGAALTAKLHWGAEQEVGIGRTGQAYAIPTKSSNLITLRLPLIQIAVQEFLHYAREHSELIFLVTRIGCGLAGYQDKDIAPMFRNAPPNCVLPKGW